MSGLKTGVDFRGQVWKGVENDTFWSEIGSGFGELGGTPPPRISQITPWDAKQLCLSPIFLMVEVMGEEPRN